MIMTRKKHPKSATRGTRHEGLVMSGFDRFCAEPAKRVTMAVNTHVATQIDEIGIDGFALDVLEMTMPEWVPVELQEEMKESLRGFSEWAALWIAESLTDCCRGDALATIGIPHIDNMLWTLYAKILNCARENGVSIANHR